MTPVSYVPEAVATMSPDATSTSNTRADSVPKSMASTYLGWDHTDSYCPIAIPISVMAWPRRMSAPPMPGFGLQPLSHPSGYRSWLKQTVIIRSKGSWMVRSSDRARLAILPDLSSAASTVVSSRKDTRAGNSILGRRIRQGAADKLANSMRVRPSRCNTIPSARKG